MMTNQAIRSAIQSVVRKEKKRIDLADPGPKGAGRLTLIIRPTSQGASTEWYACWQLDGQRHSTKMGTYPTLTLAAARQLYRADYEPEILSGKSPRGPRAWLRGNELTIEALLNAYCDDLAARKKGCVDRVRALLCGPKGLAATIGPRRIAADVTTDDIVPHLKAIRDRGSIHLASDVRAYARAAFQYALSSRHNYCTPSSGTDWQLTHNPVDKIPSDAEAKRPRDRVLTTTELRALWTWCLSKENQLRYHSCFAIRLVIATGQRPTEILRTSVSGYNREEQSFYWATTKNRRQHTIPLPIQAQEIMHGLTPNEHGWYFWRREYPDQPIGPDGLRQILKRFFTDTGIDHFEIRDLRRTWKTLTGRAGITKEMRDRLQNHAFKDVASLHYDRYDYWPEKVDAMERWSLMLDLIISGEGDGNVGDIRKKLKRLSLPNPGVIDAEFRVISGPTDGEDDL
jgi:integrase